MQAKVTRTPERPAAGLAVPITELVVEAVAALFLALLIFATVSYWLSPSFLDHFETQIACVGHRIWSGSPIYHPVDGAERYSTVLGPFPYLWNALWQGPHPSGLRAAKTSGIVACWLALASLAGALWRRHGWRAALTGCGVLAMIGLLFRHDLYWNRSDPLIVLGLAVAALGSTLSSATGAMIVTGAALGMACGAKVHAAVYFLPLLPYLGRRALGALPLACGASAAALIGALPFAIPQVSLSAYRQWVATLSHGPRIPQDTWWILAMLAVFALPAVAALAPVRPRPWFAIACWLSAGVALFLAVARFGLESHHLMPLAVPVALAVGDARSRAPRGRLLIEILVAAVGLQALPEWSRTREAVARTAIYTDMERDLEGILARTSGRTHAFGYSGMQSYDLRTHARLLLTIRGENALYLDSAALMDHRKAGVPWPEATTRAISDEQVDVFVLPGGGAPWTVAHVYRPDWRIFPDEFTKAFSEHYRLIERTRFFTVWLAKHLDVESGPPRR